MVDILEVPTWVSGGAMPDVPKPFEHFDRLALRDELFEFCEVTTDYVAENEVGAVVLIDTGARPFGIALHEYWERKLEEGKPKPSILFVNPEGFKEQDVTPERLESEHALLAGHKDDTVLVIDTCIHSGSTMRSVVNGLEGCDFRDLRTGVASKKLKFTRLKPDLVMQKRRPAGKCYPFRWDESVYKGDLLHSEADLRPSAKRETAELRREIKRIINSRIEGMPDQGHASEGSDFQRMIRIENVTTALGALGGAAIAEYFSLKGHPGLFKNIGSVSMGAAGGGIIGEVINALSALRNRSDI